MSAQQKVSLRRSSTRNSPLQSERLSTELAAATLGISPRVPTRAEVA
jgi:hypothetical protein